MQTLFQEAEIVVSIGYSFSRYDTHVRHVVQSALPSRRGRDKRLFCVLKGSSNRREIMDLWRFDKEDDKRFKYYGEGFDNACIDEIKSFLKD
jgi:hypothetical protein